MTNNTADNPAVLLERRGSIAYVTLNQPENRNTLSRHLATELREVLNRLHEDGTLKAAVLTGAGQDFSLGGSYDDFAEGMSREKEESLAYSRYTPSLFCVPRVRRSFRWCIGCRSRVS